MFGWGDGSSNKNKTRPRRRTGLQNKAGELLALYLKVRKRGVCGLGWAGLGEEIGPVGWGLGPRKTDRQIDKQNHQPGIGGGRGSHKGCSQCAR